MSNSFILSLLVVLVVLYDITSLFYIVYLVVSLLKIKDKTGTNTREMTVRSTILTQMIELRVRLKRDIFARVKKR